MPFSTVGWVIVRGTVSFGVWEYESGRFSFPPPLFKFLFLGLGLALGLGLGFEPSSPIVRELVLSLTQLSFPLVRFRHDLAYLDSFGNLIHILWLDDGLQSDKIK